MNKFWNRILRAIKLETQLYEEVEADKDALPQALGVVLMSSLAAGIASISKGADISILGSVFGFLFSWFLFSYLIFLIGTKWLSEPQTKSDYGELLRTIGFASAPGLITVAGIIPFFYSPAFLVAYIWILVATVIAVRQALDFKSIGRAIVVCLIGWIVFALLNWAIRTIIF
jgi:hypothetical protein